MCFANSSISPFIRRPPQKKDDISDVWQSIADSTVNLLAGDQSSDQDCVSPALEELLFLSTYHASRSSSSSSPQPADDLFAPDSDPDDLQYCNMSSLRACFNHEHMSEYSDDNSNNQLEACRTKPVASAFPPSYPLQAPQFPDHFIHPPGQFEVADLKSPAVLESIPSQVHGPPPDSVAFPVEIDGSSPVGWREWTDSLIAVIDQARSEKLSSDSALYEEMRDLLKDAIGDMGFAVTPFLPANAGKLLGVGGPDFAAPPVLAHPDEFKNPSSYLKLYGDPFCCTTAASERQKPSSPGQQGESNVVLPDLLAPSLGRHTGNWRCCHCGNMNFPRRFRCNKCQKNRDKEGDRTVCEYVKHVHQIHRRAYNNQLANTQCGPLTLPEKWKQKHRNRRIPDRRRRLMFVRPTVAGDAPASESANQTTTSAQNQQKQHQQVESRGKKNVNPRQQSQNSVRLSVAPTDVCGSSHGSYGSQRDQFVSYHRDKHHVQPLPIGHPSPSQSNLPTEPPQFRPDNSKSNQLVSVCSAAEILEAACQVLQLGGDQQQQQFVGAAGKPLHYGLSENHPAIFANNEPSKPPWESQNSSQVHSPVNYLRMDFARHHSTSLASNLQTSSSSQSLDHNCFMTEFSGGGENSSLMTTPSTPPSMTGSELFYPSAVEEMHLQRNFLIDMPSDSAAMFVETFFR